MKNIRELNNAEFSGIINNALPFLQINPISEAVCIHAEAYKSGIDVNYIRCNVDWEGFSSLTEALETLYHELFKDGIPSGELLFFYPFDRTKKGNYGVILESSQLLDFLIKEHLKIYPECFNVEMCSFGFYFIDHKIFYGMEHPDFLYSFCVR
ncbi:hypothetical protein ACOQ27_004603 [Escherichia coli]